MSFVTLYWSGYVLSVVALYYQIRPFIETHREEYVRNALERIIDRGRRTTEQTGRITVVDKTRLLSRINLMITLSACLAAVIFAVGWPFLLPVMFFSRS